MTGPRVSQTGDQTVELDFEPWSEPPTAYEEDPAPPAPEALGSVGFWGVGCYRTSDSRHIATAYTSLVVPEVWVAYTARLAFYNAGGVRVGLTAPWTRYGSAYVGYVL